MYNKKHYAIYLRLSKEDERNDYESNSIVNQRNLIHHYIAKQLDVDPSDVIEFVDDGYSGTNVERPGMKEMLELVEQRKIAGILVKDLSRFGRDYVFVGTYLEHVFPFLGVRFIAVNDGYDSAQSGDKMPGLEVAYKNLFNEFYSTFLSDNIKKTLYSKWESGKCIHCVPYGYRKKEGCGNELFLDPITSRIVKAVFDLTLDGTSRTSIARRMNQRGILTPGDYRRNIRKHSWTDATVMTIIKNEVYTGVMIAGKYRRPEVGKAFALKCSKEEWRRYEDAHPPIISKEVFKKANATIKVVYSFQSSSGVPALFRGILECPHCNHHMKRRICKGKTDAYYCSYHNMGAEKRCMGTSIDETLIIQKVFPVIMNQLKLWYEAERLLDVMRNEGKKKAKVSYEEAIACAKNMENAKAKRLQIYSDWKSGALSDEAYQVKRDAIAKEVAFLSKRQDEIDAELALYQAEDSQMVSMEQLETYMEATELTRDLLVNFVEKIYVWDEQHMKIVFRCQDEMSGVLDAYEKLRRD